MVDQNQQRGLCGHRPQLKKDRLIDWFHEAQTGHESVGRNDFGTMPEKLLWEKKNDVLEHCQKKYAGKKNDVLEHCQKKIYWEWTNYGRNWSTNSLTD